MRKRVDTRQKAFMTIDSIPKGIYNTLQGTSNSVAAGARVVFSVRTIPDNSDLSLWDFLFSIYVDVSSEDLTHKYPVGSALTANQKKLSLEQWVDWNDSSDVNNIRVHHIVVKNEDSVAHVYHLIYKAYTFSTATSTAAQGNVS